MTSVLNVDSIAAKDGTSPVELTKQHASKAWVNFNGTGTAAVNDSFSISSLVDNGTAIYTLTVSTAFANNQYSQVACLGHSNSNDGWGILEDTNVARTTTAVKIVAFNGDFAVNSMVWHGDLA